MTINEKQIEKLMSSLKCSRDEAIEIIKEDAEIDGMSMKEVSADLTQEQKEAIKKVSKTGTKKRTPVNRVRKVDVTKKQLISGFRSYLESEGAIVETPKTEAEMHFTYNDESYTVKLIKHRPPKK